MRGGGVRRVRVQPDMRVTITLHQLFAGRAGCFRAKDGMPLQMRGASASITPCEPLEQAITLLSSAEKPAYFTPRAASAPGSLLVRAPGNSHLLEQQVDGSLAQVSVHG